MRKRAFIIFFSIVLSIYTLINLYIFTRGWEVIPDNAYLRFGYAVLYSILFLSFVVGRFLERVALSWFSDVLVWIGSFWLGAMVYFFLILLIIDFLRLINSIIPLFPSFLTANYRETGQITAIAVGAVVLVVVVLGYINALKVRVKKLEVTIWKGIKPHGSLNIVVASDIHLGTLICKSRLERIVERINGLNPDLVLLPGDVVDEDLGPVIRQNLGETLRTIKSRLGVIAITGNHEYIGGVEKACRYLNEHGITVLRDSWVEIEKGVVIVGREDLSSRQLAGKRRKPLEELIAGVDRNSMVVILMDHQPFRLEDAEKNGVDLQLSGHTHHGQLWPFNFITKKVYEVSWGYKKKGNTHFYVSSGVGTWGPPIRTGNRPEIVNIQLTFA
jgi:predicted MPP superfamily phosphohydrolase